MDTSGDFTQQIMDFRTSYVRAVARASVDLPFREQLTNPKNDPLKILEEAFGYKCPWDLTLVLHDDPQRAPRLNPAQGRIMTLPYWGETITVFIPRKPAGDARTQLDALAAYYHENPWFPRVKPTALSNSRGEIPQYVSDPPPIHDAKWASVKRGRYNMGDNVDDFISFAAAMFNALALAWDNELMWNDLTGYNGGPDQPRKRTITLLNEWLGYNYPWDLDLFIQEDKKARYDASKGKWVDTTPPVLMLTIPWMTGADAQVGDDKEKLAKDRLQEVERNKANPGVAIMGVALYNSDGPGYPFTCG